MDDVLEGGVNGKMDGILRDNERGTTAYIRVCAKNAKTRTSGNMRDFGAGARPRFRAIP